MSGSHIRASSAQALAVHHLLAEALLVADHLRLVVVDIVVVVVGFGFRRQLSGAVVEAAAEAEAGLRQIG